MKDTSKLVTLAALVGLIIAIASVDSGLPGLEPVSDSLFWVLLAVFVYYMVKGNGCCGRRAPEPSESEA